MNTKKQYALCISNKGYEASLIPRKIYEIIPASDSVNIGANEACQVSPAHRKVRFHQLPPH